MKKIVCAVGLLVFVATVQANFIDVVLETNYGDITIELFPDEAPITVNNFLEYVDEGFYDNLVFHRTDPCFVIQGGGYDEYLNLRTPRAPIVNEFGRSNLRGTVAMAKLSGDPDSATSQFFINLADNSGAPSFLDTQNGGFTVFGQVIGGMDVVDIIAVVPTHFTNGMSNVPIDPVIINQARVVPEPATIMILGLGGLLFVRKHTA